jgi:hypothetical protein
MAPASKGWLFPKPTYREWYCICGAKFADLKSLALHRNACPKKGAAE